MIVINSSSLVAELLEVLNRVSGEKLISDPTSTGNGNQDKYAPAQSEDSVEGAEFTAIWMCEYCNAHFSADDADRVVEGRLSVQEQFDKHQCRRQNTGVTKEDKNN